MDAIANTGKIILAGTLYTMWVSYQNEVMKALTGKDSVAVNEIEQNVRNLENLQEKMYLDIVHMNADKINEMKNEVDIQNQVKEAYTIYYSGINMLNNDTKEEIANLDVNRIGMWLAQLASEKDPNYTFETVTDEQLETWLNNIGAEPANITPVPVDAPALPMPESYKPRVLKRARTDPEKMITYHEVTSDPYKTAVELHEEAMVDPELQQKFKKVKSGQNNTKQGGKKSKVRKSKKGKHAKKTRKGKHMKKTKKVKKSNKSKKSNAKKSHPK